MCIVSQKLCFENGAFWTNKKIGCIKKIIKNHKINLKIFFWPRYGETVVYFHINQ